MTWRLAAIEIEGFRGYGEPRRIDFAGEDAVLFGENHQGKSSTLRAFEWCFYGRFAGGILPERSSRGIEPIHNQFHPTLRARVEVTLRDGNATVRMIREKERGALPHFTVEERGRTHTAEAAEAARDRIFGCGYGDFLRVALLSQDTIRAMLIDDPRTKSDAISRLLGLGTIPAIDDVLGGEELEKIEARFRKRYETTRQALAKEEGRVRGAVAAAKEAAVGAGFNEKDATIGRLRSILKEIRDALKEAAREVGLRFKDPGRLAGIDEVQPYLDTLTREIRKIAAEGEPVQRKNRYQGEVAEAARTLEELAAREAEAKAAGEALTAIEAKGDEEAITAERKELEREIEELSRGRRQFSTLSQLLDRAEEHLRLHGSGNTCPVCEGPVEGPRLVRSVTNRLARTRDDRLGDINRSIEERSARIPQLEESLQAIARARQGLDETLGRSAEARERVDTILRDQDIEEADRAEALRSWIAILEAKANTAEREASSIHSKLDGIEARIIAVRDHLVPAIRSVQAYSEFVKRKRAETSANREVRERRRAVVKVRRALREIRRAIRLARKEIAEKRFTQAVPEASEYFRLIAGNPEYDTIQLETGEQKVKGERRLRFAIRIGSSADPSVNADAKATCSAGDLTAASLALFLAFTRSETHRIGFIVLDDPTQSMDARHRRRFVEVLGGIRGRRQVIISTHDGDLQSDIESAQGFRRVQLANWSRAGANPMIL